MKRLLFLAVLAISLVAAPLVTAAPTPVPEPETPVGFVKVGPVLKLVAQVDTIWTTATQYGVDNDFDGETAFPGPWLNPAKMRVSEWDPRRNQWVEAARKPEGIMLWSSGRFSYQGFTNGDSLAVSPVFADTASTIPAGSQPNGVAKAFVTGSPDTIRIRSFIETDTVYVQGFRRTLN